MTRANNQPAQLATLGPAEAVPDHQAIPPQVALTPPPNEGAVAPPPNAGIVAPLQENNPAQGGLSADGPQPGVFPSAAVQSPAQALTSQLLALDSQMSLDQLTAILNILAPNRHMRTVASNLLSSAHPPPPIPPAPASANPPPPPANPLTGPQISIPQSSAQPVAVGAQMQGFLRSLTSRKRLGVPCNRFSWYRFYIQVNSGN